MNRQRITPVYSEKEVREKGIKDRIWEVIKIRSLAQKKHPHQVARELLQEIEEFKRKKDRHDNT